MDFEVIGKIVVDSSGAVSIQGINDGLDKMESQTSSLGGAWDFVWGGIILQGINAVWEGLKAVVGSVIDFGKSSVQSFSESQNVMADLNAVLKSTGDASGYSAAQLADMATGLESVTKFSDETILRGQSMLLTFTSIGHDVLPLATQAMLDLAQKMGTDVSGAAIQLGKALNDPEAGLNALHRVGVQFTQDQKDMITALVESGDTMGAQKIILNELATEFGGVAEAAGSTFAGQMEIAKNKIDNFKEAVGQTILLFGGQFSQMFVDFATGSALLQVQNFLIAFDTYMSAGVPIMESMSLALGKLTGFRQIADDFWAIQQAIDNSGWWTPGFWDTVFKLSSDVFNKIDAFVANIINGIATAINGWINSGGPEELSNSIISFINHIGTSNQTTNLAVQAAGNLLKALTFAVSSIDWAGIADAIDNEIGRSISSHDWTASGTQFGQALSDAFKNISIGDYLSGNVKLPDDWLLKLALPGIDALVHFFQDTSTGQAIYNAVTGWIGGAGQAIYNAFTSSAFWSNVQAGFNYAVYQFRLAGAYIVDGLKAGFSGQWDTYWATVQAYWTNLVANVKLMLGISSPSTVFAQISAALVQGLIAGWNNSIGAFMNLIDGWIAGIWDALPAWMQTILSSAGIDLSGYSSGSTGGSYSGTAGSGTAGTGTTGSTGGGTVINQYFNDVVNVGAMSDLISFDCTTNAVVNSTYPGVGGLGGGPVGGLH